MKIKWHSLFTICLLPILAGCSFLTSAVEEKKAPPAPPKPDVVKKIETAKAAMMQFKGYHWVIYESYTIVPADDSFAWSIDFQTDSKIIDLDHYHIKERTIQRTETYTQLEDNYKSIEQTIEETEDFYESYKEDKMHYFKNKKDTKSKWVKATSSQKELADNSLLEPSLSLNTLLEQVHSIEVIDLLDTYTVIMQSSDPVVVEKYRPEEIPYFLQNLQLIDPGAKPIYGSIRLEVKIDKATNQVREVLQTIESTAPYSNPEGRDGVRVLFEISAFFKGEIQSTEKPSDISEEKN